MVSEVVAHVVPVIVGFLVRHMGIHNGFDSSRCCGYGSTLATPTTNPEGTYALQLWAMLVLQWSQWWLGVFQWI
jgi:hypothetical protein